MIVLDSNQLREIGVEQGTKLTLLRGVALITGHSLAIPDMVQREYLAWYEREIESALRQVEGAEGSVPDALRARLLSLVPWWVGRADFAREAPTANLPILRSAVERRKKRLRQIFRVLPTPAGADSEGNDREVHRRPPALASGDSGKGSRDTVIWLTVLAAARPVQPFKVFFVSADRGFGGLHLLPELKSEATDNVVFYNSLDRLLNRLTCPVDPPAPADELVKMEYVISAVRNYLASGQFKIDLSPWLPVDERLLCHIDDELEPQSRADETQTCRIGETVLVATNRVWGVHRRFTLLTQSGSDGVDPQEVIVKFSVKLAVLVTYEDDEPARVWVLSHGAPRGH